MSATAFTNAHLIKAHVKDLGGGFIVRRLLPAMHRQAVGPFIFFDHFGPVAVTPQDNHDVRPHPHIGLATLTYLFEGVIMHRDNLGYQQRIEPGAINLMIAGSGIVHSERKPEQERGINYVNHGLQLWLAIPEDQEECNASFSHTPASAIPELKVGAAKVRVLVGSAFGASSPVPTLSPSLYLDVALPPNTSWQLPMLAEEQAIYPIEASFTVDGEPLAAHSMLVLDKTHTIESLDAATRFVIIGGQNLGRRLMWWNFVSSQKEAIDRAAALWKSEPQDGPLKQVPNELERIPLPDR